MCAVPQNLEDATGILGRLAEGDTVTKGHVMAAEMTLSALVASRGALGELTVTLAQRRAAAAAVVPIDDVLAIVHRGGAL